MKHACLFLLLICAATCLDAAQQQAKTAVQYAIKPYLKADAWARPDAPGATRDDLVASIQAARKYYHAQLRKTGNFTYAMDIASGDTSDDDNQVRQAGALWGLVRLNQAFPQDDTRLAIFRALEFVSQNTRQLETGETVFVYPGDQAVKTGTIALYTLALTDFLEDKALDDAHRQQYRRMLFSFISFLRTMEMANGSWSRQLDIGITFRDPQASPYYDGEALLAYCRAARALRRNDLLKRIDDALPKLVEKYTVDAWAPGGDEEQTKGFYQWASMACEQYISAKWTKHPQLAQDAAFALAVWQIHRNQIEAKRGNNAYALEGLAAALHIAQMTGAKPMQDEIAPVARRIISRLLLCQFQGPFMKHNPRFNAIATPAPGAAGGITDSPDSTVVRIDVVQHQVHAMLLLLQWLYPQK